MLSQNLVNAFNKKKLVDIKRIIQNSKFNNEDITDIFNRSLDLGYQEIVNTVLLKEEITKNMPLRESLLSKALMSVCVTSNLSLLQFLLLKSKSMLTNSIKAQSIINQMVDLIVENGDVNILRYLHELSTLKINFKHSHLYQAVLNKQIDIVKYLLTQGCDINEAFPQAGYLPKPIKGIVWVRRPNVVIDATPLLHLLQEFPDIGLVNLLVKSSLDLKQFGKICLRIAVQSNEYELSKYLVGQNVSLTHLDSKLLKDSIDFEDLDFTQLLVDKGVDVKQDQSSSLRYAASKGCFESVKILVQAGANPRDGGEASAISIAINKQNVQMVEFFCGGLLEPFNKFSVDELKKMSKSSMPEIKKICAEFMVKLGFDYMNPYSERYESMVYLQFKLGPKPYSSVVGEKVRAALLLMAIQHATPDLLSEPLIDTSLVTQARQHFDSVIRPEFAKMFYKEGGLFIIERKIKRKTLALMLKDLDSMPLFSKSIDVREIIEENMDKLVSGDFELRKKLLSLTQEINNVISFVVWRAYEPMAQTKDFESLLIEPPILKRNDPVYSNNVDISLTRNRASLDIRTVVAYCYLVAKEFNVLEDLICYIAQIQRAHNDYLKSIDSPSCYFGALTRALQSLKKTPFALPININELAREQVRLQVVDAFRIALNDVTFQGSLDSDTLKFFLDSIIGLHTDYKDLQINNRATKMMLEGGKDLLLSNCQKGYSPEHLFVREQFVKRYLGESIEEAILSVIFNLVEKGVVIGNDELPFVFNVIKHAFVELSHFGVRTSILPIYLKEVRSKNPSSIKWPQYGMSSSPLIYSGKLLSNTTATHYRLQNINPSVPSNSIEPSNPFVLISVNEWMRKFNFDKIKAEYFSSVQTFKHNFYKAIKPVMHKYSENCVRDVVNELYAHNKTNRQKGNSKFSLKALPNILNEIGVSYEEILLTQITTALQNAFSAGNKEEDVAKLSSSPKP